MSEFNFTNYVLAIKSAGFISEKLIKATPYNKRKELRRTAAITNSAGMLWFLIAQAH
jgi:hypothetical protein